MARFVHDVRYALRSLAKSPTFTIIAVLSLALGIGANTAIFTLIDQVLLRLLPVKSPEQLVQLWGRGDHYGSNNGQNRLSYPMYADFRDHNLVFSGMFCSWGTTMNVSIGGKTDRVQGELVSGTYFPVLGVGAALGRVFTPDDDRILDGHPIAVLSHQYWIERFGGDPSVLGAKLLVNGFPMTVVGVSQAGFNGMDPLYSPQIRIPIMMKRQIDPISYKVASYTLEDRRGRWVAAYGRLKPGVSEKQAKAGLQPQFHQMLEMEVQEQAFAKASDVTKQHFLRMWLDLLPASSGRSITRDKFSTALIVLMVIVGLVLLIACANVANLLIARASTRQKEVAVRIALGATPKHLVIQLLIESILLALAGGTVGLALAIELDKILLGSMPAGANPLVISSTPDLRILAFTAAISTVCGVIFGLIPALQITRTDIAPTLKDQAGSIVSGGSINLRKALIAAQVMLSVVLLIAAGLFIRSLKTLKDLDPGFRTENVLAFSLDPTRSGYTAERTLAFYRQLKDQLDQTPGIQSSSLAVMRVLDESEWDSWVTVEGYQAAAGEWVDPHMNFLAPSYFDTFGVPLLEGRDFRYTDGKDTGKVAIVNEKFAKRYFQGKSPIGRHLGMGGDPGTKTDIEIIGMVRDTKYENMRAEMPLGVFRPYQQMDFAMGMTAYIRTANAPEQMFSTIRQLLNRMDPNLPVYSMRTLQEQMQNSLSTERLVASLTSAFGLVASILAGIGIYGVIGYSVSRRTREIGIRTALGAQRLDVAWLVMREALLIVCLGLLAGLPAAYALSRLARTQLYGISPGDPASTLAAAGSILLIAIIAVYVPAARATRVDPMRALRWE